ncbi:MAG: PspC domain-containing protein [Candidatus Kariarchaeaceae archaeon]
MATETATETVKFEKDPSKWYKSRSKRMIFGVLGGYSEKTGINVVLLRGIFLAMSLYNLLPLTALTYLYLAITRPDDPIFLSKKNDVTKLIEDSPEHGGATIALDRIGFVNTYYFLTFGMITFISYGLVLETGEAAGDPLIIFVMIASFFLAVYPNILNSKIQVGSYEGWYQNTIFALVAVIITSVAFLVISYVGGLLIFQIPLGFLIVLSTFQIYVLTRNPDVKWLFNKTRAELEIDN